MRRRGAADFPASHPVCAWCWADQMGPGTLGIAPETATDDGEHPCSFCDGLASVGFSIPEPRHDPKRLSSLRGRAAERNPLAYCALELADVVLDVKTKSGSWLRLAFEFGRVYFDWDPGSGSWKDPEEESEIAIVLIEAAYRAGQDGL